MRNRHFLLIDGLMLCLLPSVALLLRLETVSETLEYVKPLAVYTLVTLVVRLALFYACGLYNRYWRSATVEELAHTVRVSLAAMLIVYGLFWVCDQFRFVGEPLPRSLPLMDSLLILLGVGGSRFSMRVLDHYIDHGGYLKEGRRALILGAGSAGQLIVKELKSNPQLGLQPVGFLDDDPDKRGMRIMNLPVWGELESLEAVAQAQNIDQVIIAMPTAPGKVIRELVNLCEKAHVPVKTVPGMYEILEGKVRVNQLRDVDIEDLLRREPIVTDIAAVRELIRGKRVLITGGGGSIGSELCRQVLQSQPAELAILGHGENTVFDIQNELRDMQRKAKEEPYAVQGVSQDTALHGWIADIRFEQRVRRIFEDYRPEIVFHAAAHKHVPLMEANPTEAITNNVFGTQNLLDAALAVGTKHFVMISTDKVVNPTSVMGASKRVAELLVLRAARQSGRAYVAVRFGNVLGSRGSVVPIFKKQIAAGGPVTVSHPEMTRYFMTIPEAVQLVLQASVLGKGGEIFMLDMGNPVKIVDLARDLIELSGLEVGRDIDIVFTGIRPGEKLFEELSMSHEVYEPTNHAKVRIAKNVSFFLPSNLNTVLEDLEHAVQRDDAALVRRSLRALIPEFQGGEMPNAEKTPAAPAPAIETGRAVVSNGSDLNLGGGRKHTETPLPATGA
jgi:FlaA1/EpsC-like NDP-sugar epimerase